MKKAATTLVAAAMTLASGMALAGSTIDPNTPAQNAALNSAPIRANFQSAYNDINNLLSMYYGPTAPASPSNLQSWANSSGFPVIVLNYYNSARAMWIPYAQINVTANTYTSLVGSSIAATPPIANAVAGGLPTLSINLSSDFAVVGNALALSTQNTSPGTYGDATHVAQISVDAKGRTTNAASVVITHAANDLVAANNLSDLTSPAAALGNLGALGAANNLSDLANAATARTNLGLKSVAVTMPGTGLAIDGSNNLNLQPGTASVIGGVESIATVPHEVVNGISGGVASLIQLGFGDLSGTAAPSQLPVATTSAFGAIKPDGTTITCPGGVCSATATGTGNFNGISSSVPGDLVSFADTTGKQAADSGFKVLLGIVGDGTTNNYTALASACATGGHYHIPAGTFIVNVPSGGSICTPPNGLFFEGEGRGITTIKYVVPDTTFDLLYPLNANHITFKGISQIVQDPTGGTAIIYDLQNVDDFNLIDSEIGGNSVEGFTIGGTARTGDGLNVVFEQNNVTTDIGAGVTTGQTTAQMATNMATAINANSTISGLGIVATADGSFVKINQPDSLLLEASYTVNVTGTGATETMTPGFSNLIVAENFGTNGDEADDLLQQNDYMHDIVYNILGQSTTTEVGRRWTFRGGYYDRVMAGAVNINAPSATVDGVDVDGINIGQVAVNYSDGLPIGCANVSDMTIRGVHARGMYTQDVFHFEQNCSRLQLADSNAVAAIDGTHTSAGFGSGIALFDNNAGTGPAGGVNYISINNVTITRDNLFTQGYGLWAAQSTAGLQSSYAQIHNLNIFGFTRCAEMDNLFSSNYGDLNCINFAASTGTTAVINNTGLSSNTIGTINVVGYATNLSNPGGSRRAASCTGTSC